MLLALYVFGVEKFLKFYFGIDLKRLLSDIR